ncbi:MAG TPA: hypothetical protein VNY08_01615 [Bradyrhizobium sp.]|jgi:hypothetical protein|nr:hypothetical protein [Bradyrhizobium sp.]
MYPRFALVAALLLVCGPALAASFGARAAPGLAAAAPMTFYVVRGAADACGRGCDRWIAVEGQVDSNAAARFKKFLSQQRDRTLPIYFYSPGGNLDQAVAMGSMLREKPTVARVARTVVRECGFEAQDSEACIKLKQSARELHGDLFTRNAICASACPYLILGAATREIAPDAALAVHSPKVVLSFLGVGKPTPSMVAAATERGRDRGDRLLAGYFAKIGADAALLDLSRTVRFEDMHLLTREEIVRFGIDPREFVETSWSFENNGPSTLHKVAVQRNPGEKSFRLMQWRLICFDSDRFELDVQRPATANPTFSSVAIVGDGAKPLYFSYPPAKASGFEVWGMRMTRASVQSLLGLSQVEFTESSIAADGHRVRQSMKLSSDGLPGALDSLIASCPPSRRATPSQTTASRDRTEK